MRARFRIVAVVMAVTLMTSVVPAAAQILPVQTGEHGEFTRIVIRIGEDRQWDLQDADRAFRLSVSPGIDEFDLSGSFDLIRRDRIAGLRTENGVLEGTLACACDVTAFRYLDRFLVIDVRDEAAGPQTIAPPPATRPDPAALARREARDAERAAAAAALPDLARILTGGSPVPPGPVSGTAPGTEPDPTAPVPQPRMTDAVPELEDAARIMAEQLARAAAAGLLTPAADAPSAFADPITVPDGSLAPVSEPGATSPAAPDVVSRPPALDTPATAQTPGQPVPPPASVDAGSTAARTAPGLPLRARTALDPAPSSAPEASRPTLPLSCTGAAMGMADWAVSDDFSAGISALRLTLLDDRDRLDQDSAIRLVRHYLAYGFGVEAQFWLARIPVPSDELEALAALITGGRARPYSDVADTTACSDEEFLLRFLGDAIASPLTEDEVNRAQRGFAGLPGALQDRFGPDLARRLAAAGRPAAARNIRDALMRAGRVSSATLVALDLELGIELDAETARSTLDMALRDDGATPAPTMAQALALDRSEGRATDPARVTAAAGLLRETPPGPDADSLWRELVAAESRLGRIDAAIAMLSQGRTTHSAVWQQTVTEVLSDRLDADDNATLLLLAHLFGPEWTDGGSRAGRVRTATAERLQASGLGMAAARILANGPGLILPTQVPGPAPRQERLELWASGDWTDIARGIDGPHAELAERMARRDIRPEPSPTQDRGIDLDTLAAQVTDSGALRRTVSAVLSTRLTDAAP